MSARILIVDDDHAIRTLLGDSLRQYGFSVSLASNGEQMFAILNQQSIDLIVLDIMLPGDDGFTLCRTLRKTSSLPILMLTAAGDEADRIVGLEIGADDYLPKPFNTRELVARIKAILRRTGEPMLTNDVQISIYEFEGWQLNIEKRCLQSPENLEIILSPGEFDLLQIFVEHAQLVLSRDQLLEMTKKRTAVPFDRSIDIQISRLRYKIETDPKQPKLIKTIRGGGYMLTPKVTLNTTDFVTS